MPELPEVETTVRYLAKKIVDLKIKDIWSEWPKTVKQAGGIKNLKKVALGKKIISVRRRAKYIIIDIEGPKSLFIHQKISGHLLYGKWAFKDNRWMSAGTEALKDPKNQHIRFITFFNNGYQLALSDLRRFGKVVLVDDERIKKLKEITSLGPEPLDVSLKEFEKRFERKRGRIKQVLLDPKFVAGIGNIYGDEILWDIGLHPLSRVENLDKGDIERILKATKRILLKAIENQGSSMDDYRTPSGERGNFQNLQKAYQKTGQACSKRDGGKIQRIKINGRSAHFCPVHQILK
ncbi:MAG TPA: bifunctional DNA-formamidopyrimidine glycosylase/DNA-(apurinic or apyrimidinic site) lyase [Candidatus Paceibacterota bacterium]